MSKTGEVGCYALLEAFLLKLTSTAVRRAGMERRSEKILRLECNGLVCVRYCVMYDGINFYRLCPNFAFLQTEILYILLPTHICISDLFSLICPAVRSSAFYLMQGDCGNIPLLACSLCKWCPNYEGQTLRMLSP
jgi:hypothetical protein